MWIKEQLVQAIHNFYNKQMVRLSRSLDVKNDILSNPYHRKELSLDQKTEIKQFWKPYKTLSAIDWMWFEFYNAIADDVSLLKYYIPESIYYPYVDLHFTEARACSVLDDKNYYDLYFPNSPTPLSVVRKMNGRYFDSKYNPISENVAIETIRSEEHVIIKPSRNSLGGGGICFYDSDRHDIADLENILNSRSDFLVQRIVKQHSILAKLHPYSVNTIRVLTLYWNEKVEVVSCVLRIGSGKARVDNAHSGGVVVGINLKDGSLKKTPLSLYGERDKRELHGYVVPNLEYCLSIARKEAVKFCSYSKLLSWDFSIDENGNPVIIEVNMTYGGVDVHQLCNGPVFGSFTKDILDKVFFK